MNTATALLTLTKEIRALRRQLIKPKLAVVQGGRPALADGEIYVGITLHDNRPHHLVLLPGNSKSGWEAAGRWAKAQGGVLPSRHDGLVLFRHARAQFKREAYWLDEQLADDPSIAWYQDFNWGYQPSLSLSWKFRVRAVRRVPIEDIHRG